MAYFPMYIDLTNQPCLVVGGGRVALRKVEVLLDFDARVFVRSKCMSQEMKDLARTYGDALSLIEEDFGRDSLLREYVLVVAATDDAKLNHEIAVECMRRGIPVNAVDLKEDCSFIFPSYVKEENLVASFSSGGRSPLLTQILREEMEDRLTPFLGEVNEYLGGIRPIVRGRLETEEKRKAFYHRVYDFSIEQHRMPTEDELEELLSEDEL